MSAFEKFKQQIFSGFEGQSPGHERSFSAHDISTFAAKAGFSVEAARESMVEFAEEDLITLGSWDAERWDVRDWTEWPDVNQMFCNPGDQNCVRVKLRRRGEEYLRCLNKRTIGFVL